MAIVSEPGRKRSTGRAGSGVSRYKPRGQSYKPRPTPPRRRSTGRAGGYVSRGSSGGGGSAYGGGGGGYYGGGGISSTSSGRYSAPAPRAVPPPPPPVPGIVQFLRGDTSFQQQNRQLNKTFGDFLADIARRRGMLQSEFGLSQKAMGDQKVKDLEALEEDYGSRGLLRSGLYTDAVGDYNTEFNTRMSDLSRRQNEALGGLKQESSAFRRQTELQKQAAREAALRRRAEQYGL
jgi:hypothetical protein